MFETCIPRMMYTFPDGTVISDAALVVKLNDFMLNVTAIISTPPYESAIINATASSSVSCAASIPSSFALSVELISPFALVVATDVDALPANASTNPATSLCA
jgi:hypothetical protein